MSKNGFAPGERGTSQDAARIIGVSARTMQDMAQNGELPGAVKVRRRWTFDLQKLRDKMREDKRRQACQRNRVDPEIIARKVAIPGSLTN
jgi:predicted site-specific integrase-resolvase